MARITVTGATGFIGVRLVQRLQSLGHEVAVLVRSSAASHRFGSATQLIRGDVTDPDSLKGYFAQCDAVLHLAGCTVAKSRDEFDRVNRVGTENVARECLRQSSPPKLLFVSSLAAAGPAEKGNPITETNRPHPVSDYGRSKLAAEQSLMQFANQLPIQIIRPPAVFGDTDRHMLPLFQYAKFGLVFLPGGSSAQYSLIHVDDLAAALAHLVERDDVFLKPSKKLSCLDGSARCQSAGIVFASHQPPLTFPQVASIARKALGKSDRVHSIRVPSPCCWTLAATNSLLARTLPLRPLLNVDKMREAMAGDWTCDSSKLTEQMGFEFPVPLEQRIHETAIGYRQKGWA